MALPGLTGVALLAAGLAIGASGVIERGDAASERGSASAVPRTTTRSAAHLMRTMSGTRCDACHRIDAIFSHPIDVAPPHPMSKDLPLPGGLITCLTCHDDRVFQDAHARESGVGSYLRDGMSPDQLCQVCHDDTVHASTGSHAAMTGRAHIFWSSDLGGGRRADAANRDSTSAAPHGLDSESASCLGCHDGSAAAGAGHVASLGSRDSGFRIGADHSMGMLYPARAGDHAPLHPSSDLDDRIRLIDGRVGCGTCHSPYSPHEARLVMPNDFSRLCLSCHDY